MSNNILLHLLIAAHRLRWRRFFFWQKKTTADICILKLDAIGDAILWLDAAQHYREIFPHRHLTLCYNEEWKDIAEQLPFFDAYLPIPVGACKKSLKTRFRTLLRLQAFRFQKLIQPCYSRDFFHLDWWAHQINAQEKIAFDGSYENTLNSLVRFTPKGTRLAQKLKRKANRYYSHLIPAEPEATAELLRNAEFMSKLAQTPISASKPQLPFQLPPLSKSIETPYLLCCLGASTRRRAWPARKFAALIQELQKTFTIVYCGGKIEREILNEVKSLLPEFHGINIIEQTSLLQLCGWVQNASLVITNDTATAHIATAVNTPSIIFLGGGHFGRFLPYPLGLGAELQTVLYTQRPCFHCGWICKFPLEDGTWPCIAEIDIDEAKRHIFNRQINNAFQNIAKTV